MTLLFAKWLPKLGSQQAKNLKNRVLGFVPPGGPRGGITPKSCSNFLLGTCLDPFWCSIKGPGVPTGMHGVSACIAHAYQWVTMGSETSLRVKKSIFQHSFGITLGYSKWPKNAPKTVFKVPRWSDGIPQAATWGMPSGVEIVFWT